MRCDISNQRGCAGALAELLRHLAQVRRARILGVVDAVAEAGNLLLARQLRADDLLDLLGRRVRADLEQHPHDVGVGAAVQRPLQRADRRRRSPSGCR